MSCLEPERRYEAEEAPRRRMALTREEAEARDYADLPHVSSLRFAEHVEYVRVWQGQREERYEKEQLSGELLGELIAQVLRGVRTRLAVGFRFQDEGVYVKKLKKKVYKFFESALVLHHADGNLACVYFDGGTKHCHLLLADLDAYRNMEADDVAQIPLGDVVLPQYALHADAEQVESAVIFLLAHLLEADKTLCDSSLWATTNYHGYAVRYEELLARWGFGIEGVGYENNPI